MIVFALFIGDYRTTSAVCKRASQHRIWIQTYFCWCSRSTPVTNAAAVDAVVFCRQKTMAIHRVEDLKFSAGVPCIINVKEQLKQLFLYEFCPLRNGKSTFVCVLKYVYNTMYRSIYF